jgi:signal transduction histidine kinase
MHVDLTLPMALAALAVGSLGLWSNPNRAINRIFFALSIHVAIWLMLLHTAIVSESGLHWLRIANATGSLIAFHLWLVKETLVGGRSFTQIFWSGWRWLVANLLLAAVIFTNWYIPQNSSGAHRLYGPGYYAFIVGIILYATFLARQTTMQMRRQQGVHRAELQILLLGGSAVLVTSMVLMALKTVVHSAWLSHMQSFGIVAFYAATVIAITTHRLFDARQLLILGLQKFFLVATIAAEVWAVGDLLGMVVPRLLALFAAVGLALWTASALSGWMNRRVQFYPEAARAREAAFEDARTELHSDRLGAAFIALLKGWGKSDSAIFMLGTSGSWRGLTDPHPEDNAAIEALRSLRWVTPERLSRNKATPMRVILGEFMARRQLGVAVLTEGPSMSIFVGVGVSASRRPYTYPQIVLLIELAAIFEGAFERASFSAKAQHAEQLATVGLLGASLAHEIRNPLVSIKTFVQLLPTRYHDPVFREKFFRLMSTEVDRIDRLTEQLLELASPHAYNAQLTDIHPVLTASLELIAPKAADKGVRIETDFQASPDQAITDASAVKQVLLNLCFNAIQAMERQDTPRWVKISTARAPNVFELTVSDNGPGIAPEMYGRLFQPFHSSKSTGFGLGLAICRDILTGLAGDIRIDPPVPGQGATFRVILPCQPSSS